MTTTLTYNQLQEFSNSELIEQILLLQEFINSESESNTTNEFVNTKQKYYFYKQKKYEIDNNIKTK